MTSRSKVSKNDFEACYKNKSYRSGGVDIGQVYPHAHVSCRIIRTYLSLVCL